MKKVDQFLVKYKNILYYALFFLVIGIVFSLIGTFNSPKKSFAFAIGFFTAFVVMVLPFYAFSALNHRFLFNKFYKNDKLWYKIIYWAFWILLTFAIDRFLRLINSVPSFSILIAVIINICTFLLDYIEVQKNQKQLLQEKTEAELTALKAQVNPHFLFNALNTIYNEASKEGNEHSAELIQQLSSIMRFTLQESKNQFTSIDKEISFVEKYVALQKARLPQNENLKVEFKTDWDGVGYQIAPLMLIPFIENAFQYAISFDKPSFIISHLSVNELQLDFRIENSISLNAHLKKGTGSGIENVKNRLNLIYPNQHQLIIENQNEIFKVNLNILLKSNQLK